MDWSSFTNRISELETKRKPSANRRAVFEVIRNSKLRPNPDYDASLYLGPLIDPQGRPLCLEYTNDRPNLWFHESHVPALRDAGLEPSRKPPSGSDNEGRHSGLKSKGFQDIDAWKLGDLDPDRARAALTALGFAGDFQLDPTAVKRWIERLQHFFPSLDRFDRPDPDFDEAERNYKLATINKLRPALESAGDDSSITEAVFTAATDSNNLLDWRTSEPLSSKSNADHGLLDPAVASLVRAALRSPEEHAAALDIFAGIWKEAVPKGTEDAARQIGEFIFFHLWPDQAVYIRHTVRQDLWREAVGTPFPKHSTLAETYADEMRFMKAVRHAFEERGLAPRDMIDVQSALWVVHNYAMAEGAKGHALDRAQIEAAMDAYDSYRANGAHSDIFGAFGEPRDYWVRSSRERGNRVYPTKPLIGFILGKTELNGGWGQKADAAARLHNAGYIIVDQNDQPTERPERYEHLMEGADRIRLCALNYFIEPAREKSAREVSIRAGDLSAAIGLKDAFPNICQALGGEKFQKLAQVPPPTSTEPNPSSSTVFTYTLNSQPEADTVTDTKKAPSPSAVNLILYGPPGTGKTYQTAWEAVRLCLGEQVASGLEGRDQRSTLMRTYRELVSEGRIEFVTFHQSMSYEEFIEGLRPTTGNGNMEGPEPIAGSSGFRLECHDGIFKRICEAARLDPGTTGQAQLLDRREGLFKLSLIGTDWRDQLSAAVRNNKIFWGFGAGIDWSGPEYEDFQAVKSQWLESNPGTDGRAADISGTWYFRGAAEPGSYVLLTVGKNLAVALGRIVGDYEFDETSTGAQHSRRVEWIWSDENGAKRSDFYPQNFSAFQPMYQLAADRIDWDALEAIAFDETEPFERKRHDSTSTPLFTVGTMPPVREGTFRHIAQHVATRLADEKPDGFSLEQYREALVQEGMKTGVEPTGGWEDHNMPSWASHPDQSWLVPVDQKSKQHGNRIPAAGSESYVLIIDEINRANISKVFGELITLLEPDKRLGMDNEIRLTLPYSKKSFGVPQNLHVIGTMNTADRSIALLDTALRRRFSFKELMPDPSVLSDNVDGVDLQKLLSTINERIEYLFDREHQIGHAYFTGCQTRADIESVMRDKVIPLLAEYFYEDWSKVAAVLGDSTHGPARFLDAKQIAVPGGMTEDDFSSEKLRWTVKDKFDFSEFAA
ncbi:AAA family ATPase [Actibacterium ureilyticum]|uniref:AAA family ATPase n=1 Tax=Actibacterium ureilyticum TaxID=1590614 RepID=UPI001FE715C0|nr:AAA family ATPase [Actibacterium ureilyticum]